MLVHAECCAQVTIAVGDWQSLVQGPVRLGRRGRAGNQGWKAPLLCNDVDPAEEQILGPTSSLTALWNISQAHVGLCSTAHMAAVRV
jgi:hypothetical protein